MENVLIRKLEGFAPINAEDRALIEELANPVIDVPAHTDLIKDGEKPAHVHLIVEGFACRYKLTAEGRRHIMAYLVPGDLCDMHVFVLKTMDHNIGTLSRCKVVKIPRARVLAMLESPSLSRALWLATLVDSATLREWLVNLGQREAEARVAHLLCELLLRLEAVGLVQDDSYELPITQAELADTMGISDVHVNRVLQTLRQDGLITLKRKRLVILDAPRLKEFSGFDPNYLHLLKSSRRGG